LEGARIMIDLRYETTHFWQFAPEVPGNACGPSCNTVWGDLYFPGRGYTVPEVARLVGNNGGFSTFTGMMAALTRMDIPPVYEPETTLVKIAYLNARGYVVTVLVDYGSFSYRPYGYTLAHFVVVVGLDADYVYAHDPLRMTGPSKFPRAEFDRAINTPSRYPLKGGGYGYNYTNQSIYPLRPYTRMNQLMRQFRRNLSQVIQ
jgi:hypothetical protein